MAVRQPEQLAILPAKSSAACNGRRQWGQSKRITTRPTGSGGFAHEDNLFNYLRGRLRILSKSAAAGAEFFCGKGGRQVPEALSGVGPASRGRLAGLRGQNAA